MDIDTLTVSIVREDPEDEPLFIYRKDLEQEIRGLIHKYLKATV